VGVCLLGTAPAIFHTKRSRDMLICMDETRKVRTKMRRCRKNRHPYYNEDGTLNTAVAYVTAQGTILCKACRRASGMEARGPGRPKCEHGDEFRRQRRRGGSYCTKCEAAREKAKARRNGYRDLADLVPHDDRWYELMTRLTGDSDAALASWAERQIVTRDRVNVPDTGATGNTGPVTLQ